MTTTRKPLGIAALLLVSLWGLAAAPAAEGQAAGTSPGSLEAILKDLRTYDTSDVGPAMRLRAYVFSHKDDAQSRRETEAALLEFIQGSPAPGGLMAACRALRLIGGPDSVPVLAALVLKPETTDAARFALERIPADEAGRALAAALDKTQGEVKRGIVFSLGERAEPAAVPALERLAAGKDAQLAADAVKALGKTGGPEAVRALTATLGKAGPRLKAEAASALLLSAAGLAKSGDGAGAAGVYDKLLAANLPAVIRQAAFKGRIEAAGAGGQALILKTLGAKDAVLHAPAISMVGANFGPGEVGRAAELLAKLPEEAQVQLTAVLGGYPADAVLPHLLVAAESPSLHVRLAALRAIEKTAGAKAVAFLAAKAARTAGAEQDAAREALARSKGADIDAAILSHIPKTSDNAAKAELVRAASSRRIAGAKPALMEMARSGPPALRAQAAAALRHIASAADIPDLLGLLAGQEDEAAREAMQDTVAAVARTNPRPLARGNAVEALLAGTTDPKMKMDLLRVLGKIGDDTGLPLIRKALTDGDEGVVDAAVRALADWPTGAPRDDLYDIARTSFGLNHRVISVRAYIRMVGLEPYRSPEGAMADLLKALAVSPRPEEKKMVLGMLVRFPCVTGLKTAESLLADPAVAREAKIAADRIRAAIK
jgi:HEAT repeat protein